MANVDDFFCNGVFSISGAYVYTMDVVDAVTCGVLLNDSDTHAV